MNTHGKDWCWSWNSNPLASWCEALTHWKRLWCWERLKAGGERGDRGWDSWMASATQWTWVWASAGSWWTGKPGLLQSMELQRTGHNWATELNWSVQSNSKDEIATVLDKYTCFIPLVNDYNYLRIKYYEEVIFISICVSYFFKWL